MSKVNGKFVIKHERLKTEAGFRVVDIPNVLVDFLKTQDCKGALVSVSAKGDMHTESSWDRLWESYLKDLNIKYGDFTPFEKAPKSKFQPGGVPFVIPRITPHWLRHS